MNLLEATRGRIAWLFREFGYVYVSFSGGKDSTVLLHLCLDHIRQSGQRMGVFHIDYEAQYRHTTDFVTSMFSTLPAQCDRYWCALPLTVPCATSMSANTWVPWAADMEHLWVRKPPTEAVTLAAQPFGFYRYGMEDYAFQKQFGRWVAEQTGQTTACLVGVRAAESYDRRIMLASTANARKYPGCLWSTGGFETDRQYNFYPLHDWTTEDIWTYLGKFAKPYNRLYDLFYQAGVSIHDMRVASPFISQGMDSLKLYRAIEPDTWGKLVSRVNGVNFAGIYGGTTAMGWRSITKPAHFTWKQYLNFLLDTLPPKTARLYRKKFDVSLRFWTERGGALDEGTIGQIGVPVDIGEGKNTVKRTVRFEEYPDDLETVTDFKAVPSYKRMCVCILKNDQLCKYMGFTLTKEEIERRRATMQRYEEF